MTNVAQRPAPSAMPDVHSEHGSILYLSIVCLVAALGGLLFGFDTAVIAGTEEFLKAKWNLSPLMEGWIVNSAIVGCIFGAAVAGTLSDRFGRRAVLLLSGVLFTASAIGAAFPRWPVELVIARLIGGAGIGIASMLSPLYIAEISPPRLRGRLIALYQFAITIGILGAYISNKVLLYGAENHRDWYGAGAWQWMFADEVWRGMFLAGALPAVVFFLLLLFVPESPRWLTKQGRADAAMQILARVAGRSVAEKEVSEIEQTISQEEASLGQLLRPGMRIALLIGIVLPFVSQIVGINAVIYYGPKIFAHAGFARSGAFAGQVLFGVVNTVFTLVAIWKVDKLGRRPLLLTGIAGCGCSLAIAGLIFFCQGNLAATEEAAAAAAQVAVSQTLGQQMVAVGILLVFAVYLACFAFSFGPVCWIIISEIFPTRIRGRAMSIAVFSLWVGCALVAQTFPYLLEKLGVANTLWLYALTTPVAFVFVWALVPETKGRTLEEIETHWVH